MVGTTLPRSTDSTYLRKIRKPLVEKRRRDRMNNSLEQLKSLLAVNIKQTSSTPMARLDKADLLELTVSRLTTLTHQQRSSSLAKDISGYKKGFKDCARDTFHFLSRSQSIDTDSVNKLNNHIRSYYIEKSKRAPATSYLEEVIYAPTVSRHISDAAVQPTEQLTGLSDNYSCDQYYRRNNYFHGGNDSVNTSLNSSCDMSLDSSSNRSPEKEVLIQQTVSGDVWRPW